jgi:endophilin-A
MFSEEVEEDTQSRMQGIQMQEGRQWAELSDLLGAELEYFSKCKDILEELRDSWPTG